MATRWNSTLSRYIAGEFLFSYMVCFLFYFLIFFFNQLLLMAQDILSKGIPVASVLLLLLYSLPSFITLSVPFATLTAALMAYGRFSSDNEILAMRSAGFRRYTIFQPVLILGIILALLSFAINDYLLPRGTVAFRRLWLNLSFTHPGLELEPYSVRRFRQAMIVTGAIDEDGIHPMMIIENDNSGNRVSMMSELASAAIRRTQIDTPGFRMNQVISLIPDSQNKEEWTWSRADYMDYRILTQGFSDINEQSDPLYMRVRETWSLIREKIDSHNIRKDEHREKRGRNRFEFSLAYNSFFGSKRSSDGPDIDRMQSLAAESVRLAKPLPQGHSLKVWKLEFFQKFAIPFACIPFVVLAFPLGLSARRSGRAVGFFMGLLLTTFYWSLLIVGRSLGLRSGVSPFLVMVLPDLALLAIGIILYIFWRRE